MESINSVQNDTEENCGTVNFRCLFYSLDKIL